MTNRERRELRIALAVAKHAIPEFEYRRVYRRELASYIRTAFNLLSDDQGSADEIVEEMLAGTFNNEAEAHTNDEPDGTPFISPAPPETGRMTSGRKSLEVLDD